MERECIDELVELMIRIPSILHRRLHQKVVSSALEQVGIDLAFHHLMIMKILEKTGTMHSTEIGDKFGIAKSQMTHSIDKLRDFGMVEREADDMDRRKINIRLTQKGKQTLRQLNQIIENKMREKLIKINEAELKKLADSFKYIADTFPKIQ